MLLLLRVEWPSVCGREIQTARVKSDFFQGGQVLIDPVSRYGTCRYIHIEYLYFLLFYNIYTFTKNCLCLRCNSSNFIAFVYITHKNPHLSRTKSSSRRTTRCKSHKATQTYAGLALFTPSLRILPHSAHIVRRASSGSVRN